MLKKIKLKHKEIPVPVPIKTLGEALSWVEKLFAKHDTILTSVVLDDREMVDGLKKTKVRNIPLNANSSLHIRIESPKDLSLQTLDVVGDLASAISNRLKGLAVHCWQDGSIKPRGELEEISSDISLLLELIEHMNGILDYSHAYLAPVNGLAHLIRSAHEAFHEKMSALHWQELARVLVTRLEPYLRELAKESTALQMTVLTNENALEEVG
ncbi:MAG: hypothetical protein HYW48_00545 [Deltaproteobacteria bacterium]|nr:hypothetical protein [Deltaproteobacteria bacterium]